MSEEQRQAESDVAELRTELADEQRETAEWRAALSLAEGRIERERRHRRWAIEAGKGSEEMYQCEKRWHEAAEARAQAEQARREAAGARVRELETVLMKYVKADPCDQPGTAETELYKEALSLLFPFLAALAPQERGGEGA